MRDAARLPRHTRDVEVVPSGARSDGARDAWDGTRGTGAYFFTSSTRFANPAVTLARLLSDTFAGVTPACVVPFIAAQFVGAALACAVVRVLWPRIADRAGDVIVPHDTAEVSV